MHYNIDNSVEGCEAIFFILQPHESVDMIYSTIEDIESRGDFHKTRFRNADDWVKAYNGAVSMAQKASLEKEGWGYLFRVREGFWKYRICRYRPSLFTDLETPECQIEAWVTRNNNSVFEYIDGDVRVHAFRPEREGDEWVSYGMGFELSGETFPRLQWTDEPLRVTITVSPQRLTL